MTHSCALQRVGTQTDILGESPVWDGDARCLYWVDIRQPAIRRFVPATGRLDTWPMPGLVGCVALTDDGRLLVALPRSIELFDPATGALAPFAQVPPLPQDHRFNDGRCDRQGRFWVGTMNNITRAPEGVLWRLDGAGRLEALREGVCIPNSLAFSPDGRTMYFADSLRYELYAHDYDTVMGRPGEARTIATTTPPGFPDGSTVDAEGFLWNAEFNGHRLVRYAPDGRIDRVIDLPLRMPTCCAFGGDDLDILYVTTASQRMTEDELREQPLSGALLALDVGVRGMPEPRFALTPSLHRNTADAASS